MKRKRKKLILIIVILLVLSIICFSSVIYLNKRKEPNDNMNNNPTKDNESIDNIDPLEVALRNETYFLERNLSRYLSYAKENPDIETKEIITRVNTNLDYAFYTHDIDSNLDDDLLIIVNKYHKLPSDYEPELVEMDSKYVNWGKRYMHPTAYEHLVEMIEDASKEGIRLFSVSPYRSYNTQKSLYNNYVASHGQEEADTFSARPGYSEHQTGLAVDLNTTDENAHFENTKEGKWLQENAYKYGFILRYPQDKEYITGYIFEPWHYRYVGTEVASYINEHQITYDEYYAFFIEK